MIFGEVIERAVEQIGDDGELVFGFGDEFDELYEIGCAEGLTVGFADAEPIFFDNEIF